MNVVHLQMLSIVLIIVLPIRILLEALFEHVLVLLTLSQLMISTIGVILGVETAGM